MTHNNTLLSLISIHGYKLNASVNKFHHEQYKKNKMIEYRMWFDCFHYHHVEKLALNRLEHYVVFTPIEEIEGTDAYQFALDYQIYTYERLNYMGFEASVNIAVCEAKMDELLIGDDF